MSWKKVWEICRKIKSFISAEEDSPDTHFVNQILLGNSSLKKRYSVFRQLIKENDSVLEIMADLSQHSISPKEHAQIVGQIEGLLKHTLALIQGLNDLTEGRYSWLFQVYERLQEEIHKELEPLAKTPEHLYVLDLSSLHQKDAYLVGNKAANLAEAHNALGLSTPRGVAVSVQCFRALMRENGLENFIKQSLAQLNLQNPQRVREISREIRHKILNARLPRGFEEELLTKLQGIGAPFWAVRSSALGEDSALSFAGQFLSVLNVPLEEVPKAYLKVVASLYEERALFYRLAKDLHRLEIAMGVLILEMVPARTSGVLYSLNPNNPKAAEMLISAVWGLGALAVGGDLQPDIFILDHQSGKLKEEKISRKLIQVVADPKGGLKKESVPLEWQERPCLKPQDLSRLHQMGILLEEHFRGPQDIEWSIDERGWLFLLQTRPLSLLSLKKGLHKIGKAPFKKGAPVSPGVAIGPLYWLKDLSDLKKVPSKVILVAPNMDPELAQIVPNLKGLIALKGSSMTHLATVLREFRVPAIITKDLSPQELPSGQIVTLDAFEGNLYLGKREDILKARRGLLIESKTATPGDNTLWRVLEYILPLTLTEIPEEGIFDPKRIRTIHDLVRFIHEVSVREMFLWPAEKHENIAHILSSPLVPMIFYLIDLGGGLVPQATFKKRISIEDVCSIPFLALWQGMTHPGVRWAGSVPFELGSFVSVVSRSFVRNKDLSGKAFALISREYLNFHSHLAYHFAVVDSLCSPKSTASNYVALRFQGGGAGIEGRLRRLVIMKQILEHLGFRITIKADRITAVIRGLNKEETEQALNQVGRLLAYVRQMDMAATDEEAIKKYVKAFLEEDYSIAEH